jgi:hypothetical protein
MHAFTKDTVDLPIDQYVAAMLIEKFNR